MENFQLQDAGVSNQIHWGHFGLILGTIFVLAGFTFMQKPELFNLKKNNLISEQEAPKYYAYVPQDVPTPLVAGASTNQGPSIINEDGTVSPVDMGQVLGASTQNVELSLDDVKIKSIPDSQESVEKYLVDIKNISNGPIDNADFETALTSSDQELINEQAKKLILIRDQINLLPAPESLVKLAKLTVIQYDSAIGVLENFTKADENPELVGKYLQAFLKAQQDLDLENNNIASKYNLNETQILTSDIVTQSTTSNLESN